MSETEALNPCKGFKPSKGWGSKPSKASILVSPPSDAAFSWRREPGTKAKVNAASKVSKLVDVFSKSDPPSGGVKDVTILTIYSTN